ncbi:MAG: DNA alkylation repair protein [Clostridia bacterium]|nr:DNA alkylation repair protein [Clostridia bacterium]
MTPTEIREALFQLRDEEYRAFQVKLIPNIAPDTMIGVRTPALRSLAKQLYRAGDCAAFLAELPHRCFDENQLHAFILSEMRDFETCIEETCRFLPYVDNWATCDQLSPKAFKKHRQQLPEYISVWLASGHTYTVRFAIGMLMAHFLDEAFDPEYLRTVSQVRSEEYYVRMMVAWYFATALAKQYDAALPYIEERRLDPWTHNKAIQKGVESNRIPDERKAYLKTLRARST